MKRGTPEHPKMAALAAALKIPKSYAIGCMESLWHWAARFSPCGNIGKWDDLAIEKGAGWEGDPGAFVAAAVEHKWIDESDEFRLIIHDWHEHCDEAVKKAVGRNGLKFASLPLADNGGQRRTTAAVVYAVIARESGRVKIGFTEGAVGYRIRALQTGCPEKLELVGNWPGTKALERELHQKFRHLSTDGEWFKADPSLLSELEKLPCLPLSAVGGQRQPALASALASATATATAPAKSPPQAADNGTGNGNGHLDELWGRFQQVAEERRILPGGKTDWKWAYDAWKALDSEQKLLAITDCKNRPADSAELEKGLPQNYIKGRKWERPIITNSQRDDRAARRQAAMERVLNAES